MLKTFVRFLGYGLSYNVGTLAPEGPNDYIMFMETMEGWPGSGFESKTTEIKVRRVHRTDLFDNYGNKAPSQDELQFDVTTHVYFASGANRVTHSSFNPRGDDVARLVAHIAHSKEPK